MFKYLFIFLIILTSFNYEIQKQIDDFDIQGKWYINDVIDLKSKEKLNASFIECPYFNLNPDRTFNYENGFNTGGDKITWKLKDSSIIVININLNPPIIDTTIFKIVYYEKDCMRLQSEGMEFILSRVCIKDGRVR